VRLAVLSGREASIFACVTDTVLQPREPLPPVARTEAVRAFDAWLAASPPVNRAGLRVLLHALELLPLVAGGRGRRLRRLSPAERAQLLERADRVRLAPLPALRDAIRTLAATSYYGDEGVLRILGHDPHGAARRGRRLREQEGRP
jgi:hypothetical protein